MSLRKVVSALLGTACILFLIFSLISVTKVFHSGWKLPKVSEEPQAKYRLVLITQELETPFWNLVGKGAAEEARKDGANLEVWGSYGEDQENFLKKIEIAIDSKVDGIIVQGLDTDEFKSLTKIQAASYGIPVITVANDVPMADSLRKTYVGSDQFLAGQLIARQLLEEMGSKGTVVLMGDMRQEYYQQQRLSGIQSILKKEPLIQMEYVETPSAREQVLAKTRAVMNKLPNVNAFIAINANIAGSMVQEIGRRSQVAPYHIYSFDDSSDAMSLLMQGKLDGIIKQSPEDMGTISVNLLMEWLNGDTVPLNTEGYLTEIRMLTAADAQ